MRFTFYASSSRIRRAVVTPIKQIGPAVPSPRMPPHHFLLPSACSRLLFCFYNFQTIALHADERFRLPSDKHGRLYRFSKHSIFLTTTALLSLVTIQVPRGAARPSACCAQGIAAVIGKRRFHPVAFHVASSLLFMRFTFYASSSRIRRAIAILFSLSSC